MSQILMMSYVTASGIRAVSSLCERQQSAEMEIFHRVNSRSPSNKWAQVFSDTSTQQQRVWEQTLLQACDRLAAFNSRDRADSYLCQMLIQPPRQSDTTNQTQS